MGQQMTDYGLDDLDST